jgi:NTP pyrophosphatase (non-canonical NTP hydrolase)
MEMIMNMSNDVMRFLTACDQSPSKVNAELYKKLIAEEFTEFHDAIDAHDEIETLDACMDMIWVILGYAHMKGYKVDAAWAEVARSNLAKIDNKTGKVIKRHDGKVLKPEGWTPPDLTLYV